MQNVNDIRQHLTQLKVDGDFVDDKTGQAMIEIIGATFKANEPTIFGTVSEDYVSREIAWYESMSRSVNDLEGCPAIWKQVADSNGIINSNYGWCIWSEENGYQYEHVFTELSNNPESRRAEMIYTRPSMWKDYNHNGRSDFMCTDSVSYFIRNGALTAHVKMRSNDAVFGFKNDYAWQKHVLDMLADELNVKRGEIIWTASSLHVYERHFHLVGA